MTEPTPTPPALNEPLMTLEELVAWLPGETEIPTENQDFAWKVIEGASVVVREAGSEWWCPADTDPLPAGWIKIPYRAKLLLDLKVKNFYEHPDGAIQESVGPLSSRYLDDVVEQIQLTEDEKALLAQLATEGGDPADVPVLTGIWALSTTRGDLETHSRASRRIIHAPWWRSYESPFPYFVEGDFIDFDDVEPTYPGELLP